MTVAMINANGRHRCDGGTTKYCIIQWDCNTAVLTVNTATLQSIPLRQPCLIAVVFTQQYTKRHFDSTTQDMTETVNWSSSSASVATINSTGLATGDNIGTTTITATSSGITSNTATLTITATLWGVDNSSLENVLYCPLNADGSTGTCATTNASNTYLRPTFMALNNGASTAYVVNSNITTTNGGSVSVCPVNTDGTFGSCTTATTGTLDDPFGIALNPANTFAYVTQLRRDNVLVCPITGGTLGTCSDTGGTGFDAPYSMAINNAGTIAFIVNKNSDSIYRCTINPDGIFARCSDTGALHRTRKELVFNSTEPWFDTHR